MRVICAWCKADMGDKEPLADPRTTHGMCQTCFKQQTLPKESIMPYTTAELEKRRDEVQAKLRKLRESHRQPETEPDECFRESAYRRSEAMLEVLNEGSTCYSERSWAIRLLIRKHEEEWAADQASERRLWEMEIPHDEFWHEWNRLADIGKVDSEGGHEYRRVYRAWQEAGEPTNYKEFILKTV